MCVLSKLLQAICYDYKMLLTEGVVNEEWGLSVDLGLAQINLTVHSAAQMT